MNKHLHILSLMAGYLMLTGIGHADISTIGNNTTEGNVKAVYADFFTITTVPDDSKSSDANQFKEGEFALKVDLQTRFKNIYKMSDLKEGDKVYVEYNHQPKNNNVASLVSKLDSGDYTNKVIRTTTTTTVTTRETKSDSSEK